MRDLWVVGWLVGWLIGWGGGTWGSMLTKPVFLRLVGPYACVGRKKNKACLP